jgi:hypothetical protein
VVAGAQRTSSAATAVRQIRAALEIACARNEIRARGRRRVYRLDRPLPLSSDDPHFVRYSDNEGALQPWPEAIAAEEWPDLTFFARPRHVIGVPYAQSVEAALDEVEPAAELRSKSLRRLA